MMRFWGKKEQPPTEAPPKRSVEQLLALTVEVVLKYSSLEAELKRGRKRMAVPEVDNRYETLTEYEAAMKTRREAWDRVQETEKPLERQMDAARMQMYLMLKELRELIPPAVWFRSGDYAVGIVQRYAGIGPNAPDAALKVVPWAEKLPELWENAEPYFVAELVHPKRRKGA